LKTEFGACVGANLPADCSGTAARQLLQAKREAREMILANLAGAKFVKDASGNPKRDATSKAILYESRTWILAESSLAAPSVGPPPLRGDPTRGDAIDEYTLFRDGPKTPAGVKINAIAAGFGLRNPDVDAIAPDSNMKPVMTVVLHATNEMLHAFRAG